MDKARIYVTKPDLPPLEKFIPYLEKIWESRILTNNGPYLQLFEQALCSYLGVQHISLFSNGTLALMTALEALNISGEVITTPYTFVATAQSLYWRHLTPVFVDIEPDSCNLDPKLIEDAITPETTAILPVHTYGHPCKVGAIARIAEKHGLSVIYDAAHAFGVRFQGRTLLDFGDLSIVSFHATKVFHTFEGGAVICHDAGMKQHLDDLKNFGFRDEVTIEAPGINGKMSEFNAAFGLLQLQYADRALQRRRDIAARYRNALRGIRGITFFSPAEDCTENASYFPVLVDGDFPLERDDLYQLLKQRGIYARRYFFPLISDIPLFRTMPGAEKLRTGTARRIADQILCLPIYTSLEDREIDIITSIIRTTR